MRIGKIERKTKETQIEVSINLDGEGKSDIDSGIGFFDHMLTLFAAHGCFDYLFAIAVSHYYRHVQPEVQQKLPADAAR